MGGQTDARADGPLAINPLSALPIHVWGVPAAVDPDGRTPLGGGAIGRCDGGGVI